MDPHGIAISIEPFDDLVITRLKGSLGEQTADSVRPGSLELPEPWSTLLLDLSGIDFTASQGLGALVALYKDTVSKKRHLILCAPPTHVHSVLELGRLNLVIPI